MYVTVQVDADEVLDEIDTADLIKALEERRDAKCCTPESVQLQRIYEHYRLHGGAPRCVSDYLWETIGRAL